MPALRNGIKTYILLSIAILVSVLFISLLLVSKLYVAKKVKGVLVDVSKEKGYRVEIGDIAFGFLAGLEATKIKIFGSTDPDAYPIKIGELKIKPDIASSIIKRKLEIDEISINDAGLSLPKVGFDIIKKLGTEIGQKRPDEEDRGSIPITVDRIGLNGAEIEVSDGVILCVRNLEFNLGDDEFKDPGGVGLKGTLIFLDNKIGISGLIKPHSNETNGQLNIDIADFKMGSLSNVLQAFENPYLHGELNFRVAETISSDGRVKLASGDESTNTRSPLSAQLLYDITYDKVYDEMKIKALDIQMPDLLHVQFDGSIDRLTTEGVLNINGSSSSNRVGDLIALFRGFSHVVAAGRVEGKDLMLTGSLESGDVIFSGKAVLSGADFADSEKEIKISQLEGSLEFKKMISRRESSGLSIEGKLNSKEIVTKTAVLEDLKGDLEFKTDSTWNASELSFSLDDLRLKMGSNDALEISNLKSMEPIKFSFGDRLDSSPGRGKIQFGRDEISLSSRGLSFEDAKYKEFKIEGGRIDDILVLYQADQNLSVALNVFASRIRNMDETLYLDRAQVSLFTGEDRQFGLKGKANLKDGRFGDFRFSSFTCDYAYEHDEIELTGLEARLESVGKLEVREAMVIFGGKGDRFSEKIRFSQGSFYAPKYGVQSRGLGGEFKFYDAATKQKGWGGEIVADEINVKSHSIKQISLKLNSSSDGIRVDDLDGTLFGGRLGGSLLVNTTKPLSSISSSFIIKHANIPYESNGIFLERLVLNFSGTLDKGLTPQGRGELRIDGLRIVDNKTTSDIRGSLNFQTTGETLLLEKGFIDSGDGQELEFAGHIENLSDERRVLKIGSNRIPLAAAKKIADPFLPDSVREGKLSGDVKLDMVFKNVMRDDVSWSGKLSLENGSYSGVISRIPIQVEGVNGVIEFDEYGESGNLLAPLLREHRKLDKEVFKRFLSLLNDTDNYGRNDFLTIDTIKYGFFSVDGLECYFNVAGLKLNLNHCVSNLLDGRIYVAGQFDYGSKDARYNLSVLFKDISLEDISNRVNSIKDYITGRINGLVWLNGNGGELETIDGLFDFWSIKSKEPRRLGRAFLEKLGAKSRFFVGSSRRYDRAEISGYISDGILTFSEFDISNTILGYKNLSIKVDPRRNTISLAHMISVIREISRRAGEGQLEIDFGKKRN